MKNIADIHKKHTQGRYKDVWFDINWTHSNIVLEIAFQFVEKLKSQHILVDESLLKTGILLHDIGVYYCYDEELNPDNNKPGYINHGFIGHDIILDEGFDESVARFANTHTGIGLTKDEIVKLKINAEPKDYIPVTLEEEILCYADKFHSKYPAFNEYDEVKAQIKKHSEDKIAVLERYREKFEIPNLDKLHKKYDEWNYKIDKFLSSV